jgi:hypothetical protein
MSARRRRALRRAVDLARMTLGGMAFAACVFGVLWAVNLAFVPPH